MKIVTDRTSNPFGMRPPCDRRASGRSAVFGYGDANADFHVVGDRPDVHGGCDTGVPFTETDAGREILSVFRELGFVSGPSERPRLENLFASYVYMCCEPSDRAPSDAEYADLERFFDAELRAINAHVLVPVGDQATEHVLAEYTTRADRVGDDLAALHATDVRGRGFLVVPVRDPTEWEPDDRDAIVSTLDAILASDYRQTKGVATLVG